MLWNDLVCLDCLNFKSLSWEVCGSKIERYEVQNFGGLWLKMWQLGFI